MINCNTCNKLIPDDSEFCPFCGEKITRQAEENTENTYSLHLYQTDALLKRVFLFLEDGEFERVDEFCEHILNQEPENPRAYLAKMMAELQVKQQADLANLEIPFDTNKNYQKVVRFADSTLAAELQTYSESVKERIAKKAEEKRIESLYLDAVADFKSNDVTRIQKASESFALLGGYKDSEEHIAFCQEKIDSIRKEEEKRRIERERLAEEKRIADEKARLEKERQEEIDRIEAEKKRRRLIKISKVMLIVIAIVLLLASVCFFVLYQLSPASKFRYVKTGDKKIIITGVKNERGIIEDGVLNIPENISGFPIVRITDEAFDNISFEGISYEGDAYHWNIIFKSNDLSNYSVKHNGMCLYSDWLVEPGFDCVNGGSKSRYCVACKSKETISIAPGEHVTKELSYVPPTCLETGLTEGAQCSVCGFIIKEQMPIEATGHIVVIDSAITPTCIKTGLTEGSHCSACNAIFVEQKAVGLTEHTPVDDAPVASTCTQTGSTAGSHCSVCNAILVEQKAVGLAEHTPVDDAPVASTCTQTGLTAGSHCSVCNKIFVQQNVVSKKEHKVEHGVCTTCGLKTGSIGLQYVDSGSGVMVSGIGSCTDTEIYIPAYHNDKKVLGISSSAFKDNYSITKVVMFDGLQSIGNNAFSGCIYLESMVIPDSVTSIGYNAFYTCANLKSVVIPDSVTSIGSSAFERCNSLESITLPFIGAEKNGSGATNFGYIFGAGSCFYNDYYVPASLKNVIITSAVTINKNAFHYCYNIKSITIPHTVTSIGNSAFSGCNSVKNVHYTGTIKDWCRISFADETSNPMNAGANLYINNEIVTDLVLPGTITDVNEYAFYGCSSLVSLTIGNGVTSIGHNAFYKCANLKSVVIPDSVTSIGSSAFERCNSLESITLPFIGAAKNGSVATNFGYIFGAGSYSYNNDYVPASLKNVIITSAVIIDEYAFYYCGKITSITIPKTVTSIGDRAFCGCSSLTSIKYRGTSAQWNSISKGSNWNYNTGKYTINYNYVPEN